MRLLFVVLSVVMLGAAEAPKVPVEKQVDLLRSMFEVRDLEAQINEVERQAEAQIAEVRKQAAVKLDALNKEHDRKLTQELRPKYDALKKPGFDLNPVTLVYTPSKVQ